MQDKTAPQLSVCGAAECCRMTIFTGGFSMENIRIYEEDGYIHFIMRPEDLMRLRYSTEAKTPFADFMDRWLTQMKTQVRENTMDGYRYAFEKHINDVLGNLQLLLAQKIEHILHIMGELSDLVIPHRR